MICAFSDKDRGEGKGIGMLCVEHIVYLNNLVESYWCERSEQYLCIAIQYAHKTPFGICPVQVVFFNCTCTQDNGILLKLLIDFCACCMWIGSL